MKSKEIAERYGIDSGDFDSWIKQTEYRFKGGIIGAIDVDESQDLDAIVADFKEHVEAERQRVEADIIEQAQLHQERQQLAEEQRVLSEKKQQEMAAILITSGFNFDGYRVARYSGYISGDDVVQVDRGTSGFFSSATDVGSSLMGSLGKMRRNALAELKEAAHDLGCNAVIGVDFDYLTFAPETANSGGGTTYLPYVFGVTANGNAVVIEPDHG